MEPCRQLAAGDAQEEQPIAGHIVGDRGLIHAVGQRDFVPEMCCWLVQNAKARTTYSHAPLSLLIVHEESLIEQPGPLQSFPPNEQGTAGDKIYLRGRWVLSPINLADAAHRACATPPVNPSSRRPDHIWLGVVVDRRPDRTNHRVGLGCYDHLDQEVRCCLGIVIQQKRVVVAMCEGVAQAHVVASSKAQVRPVLNHRHVRECYVHRRRRAVQRSIIEYQDVQPITWVVEVPQRP